MIKELYRYCLLLLGLFYFFPIQSQTSNNICDYWIDNNWEQRQRIDLKDGNGEINLDVSSLKGGLHSVSYRVMGRNGLPSATQTSFFIINNDQETASIVAYEYWLDDKEPVRVEVEKTNRLDLSDVEARLNTIKTGVHRLKLRVQDEKNRWSAIDSFKFLGGDELDVILPWGSEWTWESKYLFTQNRDNYTDPAVDTNGHNWTELDYDDSTWQTLTGPMSDTRDRWEEVGYIWEGDNNCFNLRRTFEMESVPEGTYQLLMQHDDGVRVYLNGQLVVEDDTWGNDYTYEIPQSAFVVGQNILAIYVEEKEGNQFLDYCLRWESSNNDIEDRRTELLNMIMQLVEMTEVCIQELSSKDENRESDLWKYLYEVEYEIAGVKEKTEEATTDAELDECEVRIEEIKEELEWLFYEIDKYNPIRFSFDGLTAWVSGGTTLDDAFAETGGREVAARTIAAIIWENSSALTADMLQGIDNPNLLVYVNEASLAPQGVQNVIINGQAKEIILTDATSGNNNFFCPQPFRVEKISYTREFKQQTEVGVSRGWEGIALPFNVQTITHETKGTITPFGSGNGKHFWLRAYDGEKMYSARGMEAYAPYVIAMPNSDSYFADYNLNGRVTFSATNTEVYETPDFSFMENEPGMPLMTIPVFQRKAQSDSIYAINVGQARGGHAEGSVFEAGLREVRPFEVYTVHHGQGARPRYIPIPAQGNDATGIKDIENISDARENWYDLNGRKLSGEPKAKGVYLQNGKKVVIN